MNRILLVILMALFSATSTLAQDPPYTIDIPTDPKAKYTVPELVLTGPSEVEVTTRREGPSGVSFSKQLFDCKRTQFKYLGDGGSIAEMQNSTPDRRMADLVNGSISYYVFLHSCKAI